VESHVVIKKEKFTYHAQITLLGKNLQVAGEGTQKDNLYAAIDQAVERVQKQLKKFRDKIKDHHKEHGEGAVSPKEKTARKIMSREVAQNRPAIIQMPSFAPKPMSVHEASLQLEIGEEPFLVFSNATTKSPAVIYKRPDGNHGLIEPEFRF